MSILADAPAAERPQKSLSQKVVDNIGFLAIYYIVHATVAQLVEQLICNHQVGGSNPFGGSTGEVPERPKGADCKSAGSAFGGSNPPLSTRIRIKADVRSLKCLFL